MKRNKCRALCCLLLLGAAGLSAGFTGHAQEQQETAAGSAGELSYSYSEIDPNLYEGVWLSFEPGFDLYLPSDWYELPVSAGDEAQGAFYQCGPDQKGESGCLYFQQNRNYSQELEVFEKAFREFGCKNFTYASANGIRFMEFVNPDEDTRGISFCLEDGMLYTLLLSPASDEDMSRIWGNIRLSLSRSE